MEDSVITCDEIIDTTKAVQTKSTSTKTVSIKKYFNKFLTHLFINYHSIIDSC